MLSVHPKDRKAFGRQNARIGVPRVSLSLRSVDAFVVVGHVLSILFTCPTFNLLPAPRKHYVKCEKPTKRN